MPFKFYNHTMTLETFLELNWDDLPEQLRDVASRSSVDYLTREVENLENQIENLEIDLDDEKAKTKALERELFLATTTAENILNKINSLAEESETHLNRLHEASNEYRFYY